MSVESFIRNQGRVWKFSSVDRIGNMTTRLNLFEFANFEQILCTSSIKRLLVTYCFEHSSISCIAFTWGTNWLNINNNMRFIHSQIESDLNAYIFSWIPFFSSCIIHWWAIQFSANLINFQYNFSILFFFCFTNSVVDKHIQSV